MTDERSRTRIPLEDVAGQFPDQIVALRRLLDSRRSRVTPAKLAILAALAAAPVADRRDETLAEDRKPMWASDAIPGHLSATALARYTQRMNVRLDTTTIYRTTATLVDVGLIHSVAIVNRATRFGLNEPAHHHAICDQCGVLRSIAAHRLEPLLAEAARLGDVDPAPYAAITLHGTCRGHIGPVDDLPHGLDEVRTQ